MEDENRFFFEHEKLAVYQESIAFIACLAPILDSGHHFGSAKDQLDRASTSMPLNIAEGNGKFSSKDRCRYFDSAHGSALECSAALDVLVSKGRLSVGDIQYGKERLQHIVRMLMGLIKRNSNREYFKRSSAGPAEPPDS